MIANWTTNVAWRRYWLRTNSLYWSARKSLVNLWFRCRRLLFGISLRRRELLQSASIVARLIFSVVIDCCIAIALAVGIAYTDTELRAHKAQLLGFLPQGWAELMTKVHLDQGSILTLLNTEITVVSLFTTLYFTSICVIASTVYSRVPGDVRTLAVGEKVGNIYIRLVVFLGAFCIIHLIGTGFGYKVGALALLTVGVSSLLATFAFLKLGVRLFNFFDPAALVGFIAAEIAPFLTGLSKDRGLFGDDVFHNHYRKLVGSQLATLRSIIALASKEEYHKLNSQTISWLLATTIRLESFYAKKKYRVRSNSYWFERIPRSQDWLRAGHTELDLLLRTGRPPDPVMLPNYLWFEEAIDKIQALGSQCLLERQDAAAWTEFEADLFATLQDLGSKFMIDDGLAICHSIRNQIIEMLRNPELGSAKAREFYPVVVDFLFRYPAALLIGFALVTRTLDAHFVEQLASRVTSGHLYTKTPVSRSELIQIEDICKKRAGEILVEGRAITPTWFLRQLIAARLIQDVQDFFSGLIEELENYASAELAVWSQNGSTLLIAQALCSGVEVCKKLEIHMDFAKQYVATLDGFKTVPDDSWPTVQWTELRASVAALNNKLVIAGAGKLDALLNLRSERSNTDFFGQIYTITARECFHAMAEGNVTYFQKLFPQFFQGALLAFEALRGPQADKTSMTLMVDPISALTAISGYAKLFSEIDNRPFWEVVEGAWTSYLDRHPDSSRAVNSMVALLAFKERSFTITGHAVEQTSWEQSFTRILRQRGILSDDFGFEEERQVHESIYIRAIAAGQRMLSGHAGDLFVAIYLMPRMTDPTIKPPGGARSLATALGEPNEDVNDEVEL
jgi:hypothetical protein